MAKAYDCSHCRPSVSQLIRQTRGCGYEPPTDRAQLTVWQPPGNNGRCGYSGPAMKTCPGYTASLPEVIEVALARAHWKHGALGFVCEGEQPTEELLHSILILDAEYSAVEGWLMIPSKDGGGGT